MNAEIITIGDEVITGHIIDMNAPTIARELTRIGIRVKNRSSVGDDADRIEEAFRLALKRADVVITTGGLGPTPDDITKKSIVKVFKRNLVFQEDILEDIRRRYAQRGIEMPAINQNQALLPQGATIFPNEHGSAVGICIEEDDRHFISLPGVPFEMEQILQDHVIPYLKKHNAGQNLKVISLKTTGIVESKLAEMIEPKMKFEPSVRLAYLPSPRGIELRVIASAESDAEADELARDAVRQLEALVGKYVFGYDADTLESIVGRLLADNDKTLAAAESCTGGQLGMLITSVAGSSKYFLGGVVAYSNEAKINRLSVPNEVIEEHGAVSEDCAKAMAEGCRKLFEADYALSITGISGPDGGTEEKPVGTTYVGLSTVHDTYARQFNFGSLRETNRTRAVYAALEMLRREMLDIT